MIDDKCMSFVLKNPNFSLFIFLEPSGFFRPEDKAKFYAICYLVGFYVFIELKKECCLRNIVFGRSVRNFSEKGEKAIQLFIISSKLLPA